MVAEDVGMLRSVSHLLARGNVMILKIFLAKKI
jgi:hypothetical protein